MLSDGYAPATVVKRLNLLASIVQRAISEWDIHTVNHASGRVAKRPQGADRKRNRRLTMLDNDNTHQSEYDRLVDVVSAS
ncbi:hypothetical protein [Asaia spathodeae]|uniref:hypothetical protein n=1 Tax=Asaia spathodeae TaxID=657016 RepID=UPI002FC3C5CE